MLLAGFTKTVFSEFTLTFRTSWNQSNQNWHHSS